jgi:hypothetical protein
MLLGRRMQMAQCNGLNPEERARIAETQDSLIDLSVRGTKEAFEKGEKACATEIKELRREMEKIKESAMSDPPCRLIRGQMLF